MQSWHDFFIVAGTAAATLVGLLFVGLSLHLRAVLSRNDVRSLARVTLSNFALILVIALFIVIPQTEQGLSTELVISGVISVAITAPSLVSAASSRTRTLRPAQLVLRFGLSALAYLAVVAAGVLTGQGALEPAFSALSSVSIALLVLSLRNSWDLLVSVGEATLGARAERD